MNRYIFIIICILLSYGSGLVAMDKPIDPLSKSLLSLIAAGKASKLDKEEIKKIIALGADPNVIFKTILPGYLTAEEKVTPLSFAVLHQDEELLELLLDCKADPYCFISDLSQSPAEQIIAHKRLYEKFADKILKMYPKKHPISPITDQTILIQPIFMGNPQIMEKMLKSLNQQHIKEAFRIKGYKGNTLLHEAIQLYQERTNPISKTNLAQVIAILMRYNHPLDIKNDQGDTPRDLMRKLPDLEEFLEKKAISKPAALPVSTPMVVGPQDIPEAAAEKAE